MKLFIVLFFGFGAVSAGEKESFLKRFGSYLSDVWDDAAKIAEGAAVVVKFIDSYPLLLAASRGDTEAVFKKLTNKRFDVDFMTPDGTTALMEAAAYGKYEMCKILIDRGAHVNHANKYGFTAYDYAKRKGYEDIVQLLENKETEMVIFEPLTYGGRHFARNNGDGISSKYSLMHIAFLTMLMYLFSYICQ